MGLVWSSLLNELVQLKRKVWIEKKNNNNNKKTEWNGMEGNKWNIRMKYNILDQDGMVWNRMVDIVRASRAARGG